jgi:hypothetical protein
MQKPTHLPLLGISLIKYEIIGAILVENGQQLGRDSYTFVNLLIHLIYKSITHFHSKSRGKDNELKRETSPSTNLESFTTFSPLIFTPKKRE